MRVSTRALCLALSLGALTSCTCNRADQEPQKPSAPAPAGTTASTQPPPPPKLTAADLQPSYSAVSEEGALPTSVVVRFARDVFTDQKIGVAGKATVLELRPAVPGKLAVTGRAELTFTASAPFQPGTTYDVQLRSVETTDGVLNDPGEGRWTGSFTTPAFQLLRLALNRTEQGLNDMELDLVFSGPVSASEVSAATKWTVNGKSAKSGGWSNPAPNVARARVSRIGWEAVSEVTASMAAGVHLKGEKATAPAAERSLSVETSSREMNVSGATVGEAGNGFHVDVACSAEIEEKEAKDRSLGRVERNWRRGNGEWIRYCQLDDATATQFIHFKPAVKVSVAPAEAGFRIFGDFHKGSYKLRLDAGLHAADGAVLPSAFEASVTFPERTPKLTFATSGRYLPRSAWKNLAVQHLNTSDALLSIRQVPPENLVFWMTEPSEAFTDRTSNLVVENVPVKLGGGRDVMATTFLDVAALAPNAPKGLLEIALQGANNASKDTRRLLLTDLNLVAKMRAAPPDAPWRQSVDVWATDISTNSGVGGVEVKLIRRSGFVLASCNTSGDGHCLAAIGEPKDADKSAPYALVATKGSDLTYLKFDELKTEVSEADVSGEPYTSDKPYRAAAYSDRGVYRPGEKVHLAAVLRDAANAAPPEGMPVVAQITDPRSSTFKKVTLKTNPAGMVSYDVQLPPFAPTGHYTLAVEVAGKQASTYDFQVEEFVPERMKVDAAFTRPGALFAEEVPAKITARYLFGGVPAKHKVELTCALEPAAFKPKENAQLTYGPWAAAGKTRQGVTLGQRESELDAQGQAALICPHDLSPRAVLEGPAKLVASAAVFEAGSGRTTVGKASLMVHPDKFYVGVTTSATKGKAGQPIPVTGAVVDWNGAPITTVGKVTVELVRLDEDYGWYYDEDEGRGTYQVSLRPVQESSTTVKVENGRFTVTLTPQQESSGFLVRARAGKARSELHLDGDGHYWGEWDEYGNRHTVERTPRPARPTWVALEAPPRVKVGEDVTVHLKSPFKGRALFTVETNQVLKSEWRDVPAGDATWTFSVEKLVPNVYVTALVVKDPHLDSKEAFMPDRAFGLRSIQVDPVELRHTVKLEVPSEIRSRAKLTVKLDTGEKEDGAFATIAVVDEGILQLTSFKTPAPLDQLFAARALGVETYETVGWAVGLPAAGPSKSSGGDEDESGGGQAPGRVQPVKPVALWSGIIPIGKDGKVSYTFEVPQYRGKLRVMVVTSAGKRVGSAEASVVVKDPIVLQTTMPRFLVAGDEVQIPVFLTNLSGQKQEVHLSLQAEMLPVPGLVAAPDEPSPLKLLGRSEATVVIADGASSTSVFQAKAVRPTGAAKLKVTAKAGSLEVRDEADVPFVPAGPRERRLEQIELTAGTLDLTPHLKGWMPTSEDSTFWVTANPYGQAFDHLKHLVHYPYG
ncbi:MAG TPA: MG2 domain-containing protein [Myxococcaceae bacterium]|nr:MG2 domain-containing protein [Myxococcaceae bacterium]